MGTAAGSLHGDSPGTPPWVQPRGSPCEDIPRTPIGDSSRATPWGHPQDPPWGQPRPQPLPGGAAGGLPQPHRLVLLGGASPRDLCVLRLLRHAGGCRGEDELGRASGGRGDPPKALGTSHPCWGPRRGAHLLPPPSSSSSSGSTGRSAAPRRQPAPPCRWPTSACLPLRGQIGGRWVAGRPHHHPKITVGGMWGALPSWHRALRLTELLRSSAGLRATQV